MQFSLTFALSQPSPALRCVTAGQQTYLSPTQQTHTFTLSKIPVLCTHTKPVTHFSKQISLICNHTLLPSSPPRPHVFAWGRQIFAGPPRLAAGESHEDGDDDSADEEGVEEDGQHEDESGLVQQELFG